MKPALFAIAFFIASLVQAQSKNYMLTGTYTQGRSTGIYVFEFNSSDGSSVIVDSMKSSNPSYLAISPNKKFVYAVSEEGGNNRKGKVRAFSFDAKNGKLQLLNEQSSMGENPCYISVDKTGKWVTVGNYSSGSLAVLPILSDGTVGIPVSWKQHQGNGPNKRRQEGPHVHAVVFSPDNQKLYVPDLGIDRLVAYSFNEKTGIIKPSSDSVMQMEAGSGPRHFEFHPNKKWAYLLQELSGDVTAFQYSAKGLKKMQTITALPEGFNKYFTSADIHVSSDGKFLYASNRDSSNTIAIFSIDQQTGHLKSEGHQSTLGKTPRNFNFDPSGNWLLVANQNSDEIVVFAINRQTGMLTDSGKRIAVPRPVCIKWITINN